MTSCLRAQARREFLEQHGHGESRLIPLAGDASSRRYTRLMHKEGDRATSMLMDAPPKTEKPHLFAVLDAFLQTLGLRPPKILHADVEKGFLELEDFGDESFTRLLEQGADPQPLYEDAVAVLLHLLCTREQAQHHKPPLPACSLEEWCDESAVFVDFYATALGVELGQATRVSWKTCWHNLLSSLPALPEVLVLRDCHVDNLMRVAPQGVDSSLQRCGLLDFQDAVLGSPAYDLVSLLEDARRNLDPALRQHLLRLYLNGAQEILAHDAFAEQDFLTHYRIWGAQRHARVLGTFARLAIRDKKTDLSCHIPRVYSLLEDGLALDAACTRPVLQPLAAWFAHSMPEHRERLQKALKQGTFGYRSELDKAFENKPQEENQGANQGENDVQEENDVVA